MEYSHDHAGTYRDSVFLRRLGKSRSLNFARSLEISAGALVETTGTHSFRRKTMARAPARREADTPGLAALHAERLQVRNRSTSRTLEELPDFARRGRRLRFVHLQEHPR